MLWETLKLALRTLRGSAFRTALTMLSITIGTFSIVVMLSLAQSGHHTLVASLEEVGGMRLILWFPDDIDARERSIYGRGLTPEDIDALRDGVPHLVGLSSQSTYGQQTLFATSNHPLKADVVGIREGLLELLNWNAESGRLITAKDQAERGRVVVLTHELATELFPDDPALGQTVTILKKPYVVVGVLEKRTLLGITLGFDWARCAFIPQQTAEVREGQPKEGKLLLGLTDDPNHSADVESMLNAKLLSRHRGVEDFQTLNFASLLEKFYKFFHILDLVVAFIAGVSLFAGGIGVMNIMLVSVSERIREIGIRKAVGATRMHILVQFLIEAMTLSLVGGVLGVIAGLATSTASNLAIAHFQERWVGTTSWAGVAASVVLTAAIGVVFGVVPAWRASRLDIIECLRR